MEEKSNVYFGGIPTEPDVNRLMDAFQVQKMAAGDMIPYSKISDVIGQEKESRRWTSVTNAWRKKIEKDYGIILGCDPFNRAFRILPEGGKVQLSRKKLRAAVSSARRSYIISGLIDVKQLTKDEKREHDFNLTRSGNLLASAQLRSNNKHLPEMAQNK